MKINTFSKFPSACTKMKNSREIRPFYFEKWQKIFFSVCYSWKENESFSFGRKWKWAEKKRTNEIKILYLLSFRAPKSSFSVSVSFGTKNNIFLILVKANNSSSSSFSSFWTRYTIRFPNFSTATLPFCFSTFFPHRHRPFLITFFLIFRRVTRAILFVSFYCFLFYF